MGFTRKGHLIDLLLNLLGSFLVIFLGGEKGRKRKL